jgi:Raf kinase inhibitor-like YbhB/YbcL family protein
MVNIPADVNELPAGAGNPASGTMPAGALNIRNDTGTPGYAGPCPPEGDHPHRYLFTVFAVSTETLPVTADASAAVAGFNLHFTTLEKAILMGLYKR